MRRFSSKSSLEVNGWLTPTQQKMVTDDRCFQGEQIIATIDGATSLIPDLEINGMNPAEALAHYIRNWLAKKDLVLNRKGRTTTAKDLMVEANRDFGIWLQQNHPEIAEHGKLGPSAVAQFVVIHGGQFSWAHIGDGGIAIKDPDEDFKILSQDQWDQYDQNSRQLMAKLVQSGLTVRQAFGSEEMQQHLHSQRLYTNVHAGAINGEAEAEQFIVAGMQQIKDGQKLILMTDGLVWPHGNGLCGYYQAANLIDKFGIEQYYEMLKATYDNDGKLDTARVKHMDDATGIVARIKD